MEIIGRLIEQQQLEKIFQSKEAEFVAVYGRRRVGKTYLIREFFNNNNKKKKCLFFRSSGIHKGSLKKQLEKFKQEIEVTFYRGRKGTQLSAFSNWHDAFEALKDAIELVAGNQRVVLFLDEIPWMATPKSGLLEALDYYWNRYWSADKRIKLIICGSAASWMIESILNNKGGLHNRITLRLLLEPFTLAEVKAYLEYKNVSYNNQQILMAYMCLGGIPFYLKFFEKGLSVIQNINHICFNKKGALFDEFHLLFSSLFKNHEIHEALIRFIAKKREGVSRREIESHFHYKGGRLTSRLKELEEAGFIIQFAPWKKERGVYYKVVDEYTLFYLTWIAGRSTHSLAKNMDDHYWEVMSAKPAWKAWSGFAFEAICFKHLNQIKKALCIPDGSDVFPWRYLPGQDGEMGAQIDLVFDRPDDMVNLCEIKHTVSDFVVDKKYAAHMRNREKIYLSVTKTKKQIMRSMILSASLKKNIYSAGFIASVVTLHDFFSK
ncbi:MAG TPA: ATP-binding protein [Gammaproteobacteria bacterium]|jgi:AAA+ ATPase superfamily predicted ATPase|nr:ATP-binding protein [Gammaproteobacteria bacterium]